jgi:hypothetical protein
MRIILLIIGSAFISLSSLSAQDYIFRPIIDQNPNLVERFETFSKYRVQRKTKVAVVGDYLHTDVFADLLAKNEKEIQSNEIDDDLNGYVDDYFGVDITTKSGALSAPKLSGHENGIVSLIAALVKNLRLQDSVSIIPISIELSELAFDELTMKKLADAIDYARERGAKVISLSLGISERYRSFFNFINGDYDKSMSYLEDAIKRARQAGIIIFGANSNDTNRDHVIEQQIPADLDSVISVANVNYLGEIISGYGEATDLAFYGTDIYVWDGKDFGYKLQRGSSYATPLVALSVALTNSVLNQEISPNRQLSERLKTACEFSIKTKRNVSSRCVFSPESFLNKHF